MKPITYWAAFLMCMAFSSILIGQNPKHLKGPKAKNYKIWRDNLPSKSTKSAKSSPLRLANLHKSTVPLNQDKQLSRTSTRNKTYSRYTGPRVKNYKIWRIQPVPCNVLVVKQVPIK